MLELLRPETKVKIRQEGFPSCDMSDSGQVGGEFIFGPVSRETPGKLFEAALAFGRAEGYKEDELITVKVTVTYMVTVPEDQDIYHEDGERMHKLCALMQVSISGMMDNLKDAVTAAWEQAHGAAWNRLLQKGNELGIPVPASAVALGVG